MNREQAQDVERAQRGSGPRLTPRTPRLPDPVIADDVSMSDLDRSVRAELRTLSKENAVGVAGHLVMVARLLDVDLEGAQAHAETAVRRAGRVAAVREVRGMVAYRAGDYQLALTEFRTARRLSGSNATLPLMVDCERGLGRHERALELAAGPEARTLAPAEQVELAIVVSGVRRDLGQLDAALLALRGPQLDPRLRKPWSARLFYAYAEALAAAGSDEEARVWFADAAGADADLETDAAERLEEIDGVVLLDLLDGEEEDEADTGGTTSDALPWDESQDQQQDEQLDRAGVTPRHEPADNAQGKAQDESQDSPQVEPADSPRDEAQGEPQDEGEPLIEPQDKGESEDTPKVDPGDGAEQTDEEPQS